MKKTIKSIVKKVIEIRKWYLTIVKEKSDYHVPFHIKMLYNFRGFTTNEYIWYNLKENDYRNYISEYEKNKSREINGDYKIILDDKLLFEEIFRNYIKVNKTYAWISNGKIYGLHEFNVNNDNIIDFLKKEKVAVLKYEKGGDGNGIFVIKACEKNKFLVNKEIKNEEELKKIFEYDGQAILCEYIKQSKFEDEIYPYSTNTLRIVCAKKKNEKGVRIIKAVQRIGNEFSKPVDNASAGGFISEINLETGELGTAVAILRYNGKKINSL